MSAQKPGDAAAPADPGVQNAVLQRPEPAPLWPLYRAMVGVGVLCALLIVVVHQATAPAIARNRAAALEAAIFDVLPSTQRTQTFRLENDGETFARTAAGEPGALVYAGYDASDQLVGVAVEASGMGYQDTIRVLYGYSFEFDAIVGMQVLESRETPGLGDRIQTDPGFLANFERLDVSLDDAGLVPRHPIAAVGQGSKTEAWQIDGISGATISSVAVANLLRASTEQWVALLERRLADFTASAPPLAEEPSS
jgi:electron transport complex protein RnfG